MTEDEKFMRDIPLEDHENVMQILCETAWGAKHDAISLIDRVERNVLNVEVTGVLTWKGQDYWYHLEDGNNNGTVLLEWGDGRGIDHEVTPLSLVPKYARISDAIGFKTEIALLEAWKTDCSLSPKGAAADVLSKYAYDRHFAPGTSAARTHLKAAQALGYEIEDETSAISIRTTLLSSALVVRPDVAVITGKDAAHELISTWDDLCLRPEVIHQKALIIGRMARDFSLHPTQEDLAKMKALGVTLGSEVEARRLRFDALQHLLCYSVDATFDRKALAINPVSELFNRLDPHAFPIKRVDPYVVLKEIMVSVCLSLSKSRSTEIPDWAHAECAKIGMELSIYRPTQELEKDAELGI